jgi:hypothetical protein
LQAAATSRKYFDAEPLEPPPGLAIVLEGDNHAWLDCEHVRAHGLEFVVGHLDEPNVARSQQLDEANG